MSKELKNELDDLFAKALEDESANEPERPTTRPRRTATSAKKPGDTGSGAATRPPARTTTAGATPPPATGSTPQRPATTARPAPAKPTSTQIPQTPPKPVTSAQLPPAASAPAAKATTSAQVPAKPAPAKATVSLPKAPAKTGTTPLPEVSAPKVPAQSPAMRSQVAPAVVQRAPAPPAAPSAAPAPGSTPAYGVSQPSMRPAAPATKAPPASRGTMELDPYIEPSRAAADEERHGRAQPLFKKREQRPQVWKPSPALNVLLGAFPGARLIAFSEVARGLMFASLGLFAALSVILVVSMWGSLQRSLVDLAIDPRWSLAHAAVVVAGVSVFELLRFVSGFTDAPGRAPVPVGARVLAAFTLPAVAVLFLGPAVVRHAPRHVETAWFAALVLAVIGLVASVSVLAGERIESERPRPRFVLYGLATILALVLILFITGTATGNTMQSLAALAQSAGFRVLPNLLRTIDFGG